MSGDHEPVSLSIALRDKIDQRGLSQEAAAEWMGVSQNAVTEWLNRRVRTIRPDNVRRLATFLGVPQPRVRAMLAADQGPTDTERFDRIEERLGRLEEAVMNWIAQARRAR